MLSHNALVVVADGHQAILFRNAGRETVTLEEKGRLTPKHLQDESQGKQPEETTPRDEDEATFAKQLAERLNRMALDHEIGEIVIVADPSTLGTMRKHYHKALEQRIVRELSKTLTTSTPAEIARAVG